MISPPKNQAGSIPRPKNKELKVGATVSMDQNPNLFACVQVILSFKDPGQRQKKGVSKAHPLELTVTLTMPSSTTDGEPITQHWMRTRRVSSQ